MQSAESQYLDLCNRILKHGTWVENERTGTRCLTVINADITYPLDEFPLITIRRGYWKSAIAELIGYLRGYSSAEQFRELGCKTWDANANENEAWLTNPSRLGRDDMGRVYGVQGREWASPVDRDGYLDDYARCLEDVREVTKLDQLQKVIDHLSKGIDDRGEILTFWNPGEFHLGCLRPCLHSYQFSILDGKLFVNATQRSCDVALGLVFNMVQVYTLAMIVCEITGLKPGGIYHKIVNAHIYDNQIDVVTAMLRRSPKAPPKLYVPEITWESLNDGLRPEHFSVDGYEHHPHIDVPFTV